MMDLVEIPQHLILMQQDMGEPLNKIQDDEENEQLGPGRHARKIQDRHGSLRDAQIGKDEPQYFVKSADRDRKHEKVEEHVKSIQPEILSENGLFFPPGK